MTDSRSSLRVATMIGPVPSGIGSPLRTITCIRHSLTSLTKVFEQQSACCTEDVHHCSPSAPLPRQLSRLPRLSSWNWHWRPSKSFEDELQQDKFCYSLNGHMAIASCERSRLGTAWGAGLQHSTFAAAIPACDCLLALALYARCALRTKSSSRYIYVYKFI